MNIAIINDSPLAVEALRRVVVREHTIAWIATNGEDGIKKAAAQRPDLILMDLVMPGVNGAHATKQIMRHSPCPILVVTSTVSGNFSLVYEALGAGAVDAVQTPTLGPDGKLAGSDALSAKLNQLNRKFTSGTGTHPVFASEPVRAPSRLTVPLVAIGASTGGPQALAELLAELPKQFPASVVIVQHIDSEFSSGLVTWLNEKSTLPVRAAEYGKCVEAGKVFVSAKNDHLVLTAEGCFAYTPYPVDTAYKPNIDVFFESLVTHHTKVAGSAILLTGMGRDGAAGLLKLRAAGWTTYAQDAASCAVNGMPDAAIKLGAAVHVLPPATIGRDLGMTMYVRKHE